MGLPWRVAFALQADGWILRSRITWIKKTAMPESVKNRPTNATEDIFLFAKSPTYFYDPSGVREPTGANLRNYWILGPDVSGNGHPAAFPRELARRCILLGSREGDTILDPFGGSGTTGVVASELGRKSILVELNPDYAKLSREKSLHGKTPRIKAANSQLLPRSHRKTEAGSNHSSAKHPPSDDRRSNSGTQLATGEIPTQSS
jgi:site-specific DNA-methyltransferase (adenine-specific)/site-specific DNA-methyltransferase (cytosine-N4-specific)